MLPLHQWYIWVDHRESNPNLQSHKLPCFRYTMNHIFGCRAESRTRISGLMRPVWKPILPAVLVSEAGVEPAKPASLAQYLCQFGYTDKYSGTFSLVSRAGIEPAVYAF